MEKLLLKLGVSKAILDKLKAEGADVDAIATEAIAEMDAAAEARLKPGIEKTLKESINAAALKSVQESIKTRLHRDLNMALTNLKGIEFDEFIGKVKETFDGVKNTANADMQAKIDDLTAKYSKAVTDLDTANQTIESKGKEVEAAIATERAKLFRSTALGKFMSSVEWAFDEEERKARIPWLSGVFESEISKFMVDDQGNLTNEDKTPVLKSDGRSIYKNLDEYLNDRVDTLGFRAKNGQRAGGAGPTYTGQPDNGSGKVDHSESQRIAGIR